MNARACLAIAFAAGCLLAAAASDVHAIDCSVDSTGFVPLNDLGAGTHLGFQGGLYPGGSNHRPQSHNAAGRAIAYSIVPVDTLGQPDAVTGRIVFAAIGLSNTGQEWREFIPKAQAHPALDPRVLFVNATQGGIGDAGDAAEPTHAYWDTVRDRLRARGASPAQVQVVWLKTAIQGPSGPFDTATLHFRDRLAKMIRNLRDVCPNVKLAYLTSRIYAGYADTNGNPEPYAYGGGFAVKWVIEDQIAGVDSLEYRGASPEAPWLAWGPYLWADGLEPRSDGLTWACSSFMPDGTHPTTAGAAIVADSLLAFFTSDETSVPWFTTAVLEVPEAGAVASPTVAPNPVRADCEVRFAAPRTAWRLDVLDLAGRRLRALSQGAGGEGSRAVRWNARDDRGSRVPVGIYWLRLHDGAAPRARRVVVMDP